MSAGSGPGAEWLEADGLGGFASGTADGVRTRRYHALLLAATAPPAGRVLLVNGLDAFLDTADGPVALSSQRYAPGVIHPDGASRIESFAAEPWPRWRYRLGASLAVEHELLVPRGAALVALAWRLAGRGAGLASRARLRVRPFLSGRDPHHLHHENPHFRFASEPLGPGRLRFRPYAVHPAVLALASGSFRDEPHWYRSFLYEEERERGLDAVEDLGSPGEWSFDLAAGEAVLLLAAEGHEGSLLAGAGDLPAATLLARLREAERARRARFPSRLHRAADAYVVRRGTGLTVVAGYPWFGDWGRDTFVALRGLCLATGRIDEARSILVEWAGAVSEGMLPNRFPDRPGQPLEYNSVDAALWYVIAVHDTLAAAARHRHPVPPAERAALAAAVASILEGYARGTRHGIHLDADGLLAAGLPGLQLTWMDAKVGDRVITPRVGKPIEVQALWLNALRLAAADFPDAPGAGLWPRLHERGLLAFHERFWDPERGHLHDLVDPGHRPGESDPTFRPNQVLAVGGLPLALIEGAAARRIVDAVEARLWTPLGLRTLAPGEPGYAPRYRGGVAERDAAYHQGTAWPWLLGPFVEAWVRVRGSTPEAKAEARARFLAPLLAHLDQAGLGHVSEIADAEPPHTPRGCPFQAWSVGEALRLDLEVLAEDEPG